MRTAFSTGLTALMTVAVVTAAAAQDGGARRPSDGLFGAGNTDQSRQTLDATLFISAGQDDNGSGDNERVVPEFGRTGPYELLSGSLSYLSRGERVQWGVGGGSSLRYAHAEGDLLRAGDYGAFGLAGAAV